MSSSSSTHESLSSLIGKLLGSVRGHGAGGCVRIGAHFSPAKAEKLGWPDVVALANSYKGLVELSMLPADAAAVPVGQFDVLITKLTDELTALTKLESSSAAASGVALLNTHGEAQDAGTLRPRLASWERWLAQQSEGGAVLIDSVAAQRRVTDRGSLFAALSALQLPHGTPIRVAAHVLLPASELLHSLAPDAAALRGVPLPVICKTVRACGASEAHEMSICLTARALREAATAASRADASAQLFVQQYVAEHNAALYKVFGVGAQHVHVVVRPSLANLSPHAANADQPLSFHSQKPLPAALEPGPAALDNAPPKPSDAALHHVAAALQRQFGLTLVGYDLVCDPRTGLYYLIDVNYFPGYRGVPHFAHLLLHHALTLLAEKQQQRT